MKSTLIAIAVAVLVLADLAFPSIQHAPKLLGPFLDLGILAGALMWMRSVSHGYAAIGYRPARPGRWSAAFAHVIGPLSILCFFGLSYTTSKLRFEEFDLRLLIWEAMLDTLICVSAAANMSFVTGWYRMYRL